MWFDYLCYIPKCLCPHYQHEEERVHAATITALLWMAAVSIPFVLYRLVYLVNETQICIWLQDNWNSISVLIPA